MPWGAIAGSGWASGLNIYGTVLLLGLAGRFDWATTPKPLQSTAVLIAAGVLYLVEFVADKIPYIDNAWDSIHTAIRPLGAAWLAMIMADGSSWIPKPAAAAAALGLAITSHGAKATTRAAVNVTPEPFSNTALSVFEDGLVAGMVTLALSHPRVALVVAVVAAVLCVLIVYRLARFVRRIFRRTSRLNAPAA